MAGVAPAAFGVLREDAAIVLVYRARPGFRKPLAAAVPAAYIATMRRDEAIARLKQYESKLKELGVEHLYLFGSTARDEARQESDVDLFFDHPEGSLGLFKLMEIKEFTADILGCKADVMTRRSLHPYLRDRIETSAMRVF
jgi:predicted nucleotidyltransferase